MWRYHYIIMDSFKPFIAENYPHWIMLNISLETFLNDTWIDYTHQKLLDFTILNVPSIDIKRDKFQWIFEPCCEKYFNKNYLNLKKYYDQNADELNTESMPIPMTISRYLNMTENIYIKPDKQREDHSHIVTMNKHKFVDNNYFINILENEMFGKLSDIWMKHVYISSDIERLQSLSNNRPLLVSMSGETFDAWRIKRSKNLHGYAMIFIYNAQIHGQDQDVS